MILAGILVVFATAMLWLAALANKRFRQEARLPMQWSLSGAVNWTAPRILAVSFIPAVATLTLTIALILSLTIKPRSGQGSEVIPTFLIVGATAIACQLFHLWLVERTVRRSRG